MQCRLTKSLFDEQIVCQGSLEDSPPRDGVQDGAHNDPQKDDFKVSDASEDDMEQTENEYAGGFPQAYNGRKGWRRTPYMNSAHNMSEGDVLPIHPKAPAPYHQTGSRGHPPSYPGRESGTPHEERYEIRLTIVNYAIMAMQDRFEECAFVCSVMG
jgi:hypothetical protein